MAYNCSRVGAICKQLSVGELGPTQSLQVTRRTWAIGLPAVYAGAQVSGWRSRARNYSAAVCPLGAARDGRCRALLAGVV